MRSTLFQVTGLSAILLVPHVSAFFPTDFRENIVGNGGVSHVKQTEDVFNDLALNKYFKFLKGLTPSMIEARKTITKANEAVDDNQHDSELHFDGENFVGGQQRLTKLKTDVITALGKNDATLARNSLGAALHTVQDFYAHRSVCRRRDGICEFSADKM